MYKHQDHPVLQIVYGANKNAHDRGWVAEEVRHGMGQGIGRHTALADYMDERHNREKHHCGDRVQREVVQANQPMIGADGHGGRQDLYPGRHTGPAQLLHQKAAEEQFLSGGQYIEALKHR